MSHAPKFEGRPHMPYGLSHALVFNRDDERGTVVALFTDKTLCDKTCNELNDAFVKPMYAVTRIFGD